MMRWLTPKRRYDIGTWIIFALIFTGWIVVMFLISP